MKTKTAAKHTPGWRYIKRVADDPAALPQEGESGVIYEFFVLDETGREVVRTYDEEHARLIAAAPDLLAVLKGMVAAHEDHDSSLVIIRPFLDEARAAIAKAEQK